MKKEMVLRAVLGIPIGISIGYLISILISAVNANGYYSPCVPELAVVMGNEINAVILQAVLCGLLGISFGASSIIWKMEHWSLAIQTGGYFSINSLVMLAVAYALHWMEHSVKGFLEYLGIFVLIFVIIWIVDFIIGKHNVKRMNDSLNKF